MPLNVKQEQFARAIAAGKPQSVAYAEVYGAGKRSEKTLAEAACRLANTPQVRMRINVITEGATRASIKAAAHTIDVAIDEVDQIMHEARANGQASAAVAAAKLKSQLAGHVLDRKEIREIDPLKGATLEELVKLRDEITRRMLAAREAEDITAQPRTKMVGNAA